MFGGGSEKSISYIFESHAALTQLGKLAKFFPNVITLKYKH
jgi:hypothetical protein